MPTINELIEASVEDEFDKLPEWPIYSQEEAKKLAKSICRSLVQGIKENGVPERKQISAEDHLQSEACDYYLLDVKAAHNSACDQMDEYLTIK